MTENMQATENQATDNLGQTVDDAEIAKFAAMAEEWWDPHGKFKPLHKFNPVRIEYLRNQICAHFGRDPLQAEPLKGLRILDIGSGGGLLCEPMCRMGAEITGVDATEKSVHIAKSHAETMGLQIDYRYTSAEQLVEAGEKFDVVLNMEVVEHVADVNSFVSASSALVKEDGCMFMATMNRTAKSYALAIVGAEYILGWLPRGTHDWKKFLKPSELSGHLRNAGMQVAKITGVSFNPLQDKWSLAPKDLSVNYMLMAKKS
ncbi:bifunctional 2-polyprenyl-6-hydroxyphenol methylase/3-demethylubiquinol 3-O-methyltransferase UbiG [Curvivirga sp.]|uniref:bifunctional 2-polyprenyl-6-hydroxyphenol methylase/3-demethylubiquinol 3-O-methyltransferase UbiG n=1 Tax=Curvivirga sp. TaxID=2856848 RepID=UPI003B5C141F